MYETLSRSELLKARGYDESPYGTAPADTDPATSPEGHRRATRKRTRQRRWAPGRTCDRCGAPPSEFQGRWCSNACRYPDRPPAQFTEGTSEPAETSPDDGHEPSWGVLELQTRSKVDFISVKVVLGGEQWTLTRE